MNTTRLLSLTVLTVLAAAAPAAALAEPPDAAPTEAAWRFSVEAPTSGVGIEASALWPIFPGNLLLVRAAIPLSGPNGELLLGIQGHVPHDRAEEGRFSSLAAQVGWRQHFLWGLHADAVVNAGLGRLRDATVGGGDYDSFDVELMATLGWRFGVGPLYAVLQPVGLGAVVYKSKPWAIEGRTGRPRTEGPIYVGNVLLGWKF